MNFSEIIHDPERRQFRMIMDGTDTAWIDYTERDGILYLHHAEVPYPLRGKGIGNKLVEKTFAYIEGNGRRAVALCPFIKMVARRSPKWQHIIRF